MTARRGFFLGLLATGAALTAPRHAVAADPRRGFAARLLSQLSAPASALALGRRAARHVPAGHWTAAATPLGPGLDDLNQLHAPALLQLMQHRISADFAAERIVVVDGWVLSETEAHLLAHLARATGGGAV